MPTVVEKRIEFNYPTDASFRKFDIGENKKAGWKGVDFIIDEGSSWTWLEVSDYRYERLRHKQLPTGGRTKLFGELLEKYLRTTSFLAHKGDFVCKPLLYALLLELPQFDSALFGTVAERMHSYVRPGVSWQRRIESAVFSVESWNDWYPEYSARRV